MKEKKHIKRHAAIVFCLTKNHAFAVACVLLDIKKFSSKMADQIIVYHDGIKEKDQQLINSILPTKFVLYDFPIKDTSFFNQGTLSYFTKMVFAKFEPLKLLNEYKNIILLDYDIKILGDISHLLAPSESGIKAISSERIVIEGLHEPVVGYDLHRNTWCASLMVFQDNLLDYNPLYRWCYEKTEQYAPVLYLPEQAIFDFMFQEFKIVPEKIDGNKYCCHPDNRKGLSGALILHAYGQPKFWNGLDYPEWFENYEIWKAMGGTKYEGKRNCKRNIKYLIAIRNGLNKIFGIATTYIHLYLNRNELARHSLQFKYFKSLQYKRNNWTLGQCKIFGKEFENIYFDPNFIVNYNKLLDGLDDQTARKIKLIYLRMLVLSFLNRDSFFLKEEEELFGKQEKLISNISYKEGCYNIGGYKFVNKNMTIHNFVNDMGLKLLPKLSIPYEKDIIDVGAYVGDSSLILTKYTNRKVHAFEPFEDAYNELIANIGLNKLQDKILPVKVGLSDSVGRNNLYYCQGQLSISTNNTENSLTKGNYDVTHITTNTIDYYVTEKKIYLGIIKIDAEGAEQKVLEGARKTIIRDKPILLVSIYHNVGDFFYIKPWLDDLNIGYKYLISKPESTTFIEETLLVCY